MFQWKAFDRWTKTKRTRIKKNVFMRCVLSVSVCVCVLLNEHRENKIIYVHKNAKMMKSDLPLVELVRAALVGRAQCPFVASVHFSVPNDFGH